MKISKICKSYSYPTLQDYYNIMFSITHRREGRTTQEIKEMHRLVSPCPQYQFNSIKQFQPLTFFLGRI